MPPGNRAARITKSCGERLRRWPNGPTVTGLFTPRRWAAGPGAGGRDADVSRLFWHHRRRVPLDAAGRRPRPLGPRPVPGDRPVRSAAVLVRLLRRRAGARTRRAQAPGDRPGTGRGGTARGGRGRPGPPAVVG